MDFYNLKRIWTLGEHISLAAGLTLGSYVGTYRIFEVRSRAAERKPTSSIFIEDHGDISGDNVLVSFRRRAEDSLHEPNYGTGAIKINDDSETYIENGRTTFRINQKVFIFAGFEDDNLPRFGGIIRDVYLESTNKEITLTIAEEGYKLRTSKTSGDFSAYTTPKLLIDYLGTEARLGDIVYENETGPPSTLTFGYTNPLGLRNYWAMIHGASLCIGYQQHFDEKGRLNLTRRTTFEDTGYVFDDSNIEYILHKQIAEIINHKTIDFVQCIRPEFTAGDGIVPGQHTRSSTNSLSRHKYGEYEDQETDELIGNWTNAGKIIDQTLDYFPYPREIYDMKTPALPQLQIFDRIFVNSEKRGISGNFKIIGIDESISPTAYNAVYSLLSSEERF